MKLKPNFTLRQILSEYMIVSQGIENIDFSKIISLNDSSAFLWKNLQGKDFTPESMAQLLTDEYEVDYETALADSKVLADKWIEVGIVEA
ncbi:MAG: PqqD family protein [Prevotellaceae bacterium]|nr:PqqD family protein [Prevotellaceae bacterium]